MTASPVMVRAQTAAEELANSLSHGVGLLAALFAAPVLIVAAARTGSAAYVTGVSVFVATVVLLYLSSTLYHRASSPRAKKALQVLDHSAIFLLIAGSYTPFTLGVLRGPWGWSLFGVVWGLAALGIFMKVFKGTGFPLLSNALYLGMGWLCVVAGRELWNSLSAEALGWLVAGGLAYTVGVVFYVADHRRYAHFVWHLFVLAGTACHVVAVYHATSL